MMTYSQQCGSSAKSGLEVHELTLQGRLDKYELSIVFEISVGTLCLRNRLLKRVEIPNVG